jgi:hypothetical protein
MDEMPQDLSPWMMFDNVEAAKADTEDPGAAPQGEPRTR